MKLSQIKILADENLSPRVVAFLRQAGLDIRDTKEEHWHGKTDADPDSLPDQKFLTDLGLAQAVLFRGYGMLIISSFQQNFTSSVDRNATKVA